MEQSRAGRAVFEVADLAQKQGNRESQIDWRALAWASLKEVCTSPTASPMLWYEDVFFDVGQELRIRRDPEALVFFERSLAHNIHHNAGDNVVSHLRDLAESYLSLDDLDQGLAILAALLRHDPSDVWTYNLMAITFHRFGLTELGAAATQKAVNEARPLAWRRGAQRPHTSPARLKLGRNDLCWCGSGKKYKHCHLRSGQEQRRR